MQIQAVSELEKRGVPVCFINHSVAVYSGDW